MTKILNFIYFEKYQLRFVYGDKEDHMTKILLIEDDPNIRTAAEFALDDAGYSTITCDNGRDGYTSAINLKPDIILLDLMLPEMNGRTFLKEFRKNDLTTPIIVVTAYSSEQEKVFCLDAGADDFIDKPFSINELLARIRANLRRTTVPAQTSNYTLEQFGDLSINMETKEVCVKNAPVALRNREYEILELLAQNRGSLVTKKEILHTVWKTDDPKKASVVDVHMHNLRKSLEKHSDYRLITTEYGQGYRLEASPKNTR